MDERRAELDLTWDDVAKRAPLSKQGLHTIRFEDRPMRQLTKARIERALEWAPGSVDRILAGGDPEPLKVGRIHYGGLNVPAPPEETVFERLDRLVDEWRQVRREDSKQDQKRAEVLEELLNSWRGRDAG
ncbi:hypothetical protein SAMN04489712_105239 [Thermomonospora echinospora]|uniref:Uncharacterized protein n=2 Tax=Thermomonospora echinospora TaxID=1992 RepID=A0A1H6A635_9ACTN|nr:hypothetical protein SAMN04489712_105239 [Thermomonospora echinospora]